MGVENYLGISAICGDEGTGKTTMALTFPKPIRNFDVDVGGFRRAIWRLSAEGVESKSYPRPIQVDKLMGTQGTPSTRLIIPKKVEGMKELWQMIVTDFVAACQDPTVSTIIIDSATLLWNICHTSHLQELQERQLSRHQATNRNTKFDENDYRERLQPMEYGPANDRMRTILHCLHPDTRILKADLTWIPIKDARIGDKLIGIDEYPNQKSGRRKLRRTIVENTLTLTDDAYVIGFNKQVVIANGQHLWLRAALKGAETVSWIRTDELKQGMRIKYLCEPWKYDSSRDAGYLAGAFDGEGSVTPTQMSFAQLPNVMANEVSRIVKDKDYNFKHDTAEFRHLIMGRQDAILRFLGSIRPLRLLDKAPKVWEGRETPNSVEIDYIIKIGCIELIDLQTSTHTFIAEGLLTHNTARSFQKNLVLTHYPTDEYGAMPDGKGNMVEGKTGKRVLDGFKETLKLVDLVVWTSIKETTVAGRTTKEPICKITKCGLEGAGLAAVDMETPATYEGITNLVNLLKGTQS